MKNPGKASKPCRDFFYGNTAQFGKKSQPEFLPRFKVPKTEESCMYPQGACRIRKPAYAGDGCGIFPVFKRKKWGEKTAETRRHNCAALP